LRLSNANKIAGLRGPGTLTTIPFFRTTSTFVGEKYGNQISWKNLDLIGGFERLKSIVGLFYENAPSAIDGTILPFLYKLDIGKGYLDRPCLFPTALDCPRRCNVLVKVRESLGLA
uniref:Uncharacterized protein n=1 Tax=Romanomermis culicivorax TaxID=13658 RepID=A0A915L763_ROMCU